MKIRATALLDTSGDIARHEDARVGEQCDNKSVGYDETLFMN